MANKKGIEAGRAYIKAWWDGSAVISGVRRMGTAISSAGRGLVAVGAGVTGLASGMLALFVAPIKAAGEMEAGLAAFETIFKDNTEAVGKWGEALADEIGRSKTQVREFLTGTQARFIAMPGIDPNDASEMSKTLTELAYDLAAFYDRDDGDAMQALRNAMTGEMEMLKGFGTVISAADVDAQLEAMGLGKNTATQAEKAAARFQLVLQRTAAVQGTALRESGELGSMQKRLAAQFQTLAETIGKTLLPTVLAFMSRLSAVGKTVQALAERHADLVPKIARGIVAFAAGGVAITGFGIALIFAGQAAIGILAIFKLATISLALLLTPFGTVAAVAATVAAGLLYAAHHFGLLQTAIDRLAVAFGPLVKNAREAFDTLKALLSDGQWKAAANLLWAGIVAAWTAGKNRVLGIVDELWTGARLAWERGIAALNLAGVSLQADFAGTWIALSNNIADAWSTAWTAVVDTMRAAIRSIVDGLAALIDAWESTLDSLPESVRPIGRIGPARMMRRVAARARDALDAIRPEEIDRRRTGPTVDDVLAENYEMAEQQRAEARRVADRRMDAIESAAANRAAARTRETAAALADYTDSMEAAKDRTKHLTDAAQLTGGEREATGGPETPGRSAAGDAAKSAANTAALAGSTEFAAALAEAMRGKRDLTPGEAALLEESKKQTAALNEAARNRVIVTETKGR